jgi:lipopolysaccharide transport protein LptA
MVIHFYCILLVVFSCIAFGKVDFSADYLSMDFPSLINASGNARFNHESIAISSDTFTFDSANKIGSFRSNVTITHGNSKLGGNHMAINLATKEVKGHGDIVFKGKSIIAYSDELMITNYEQLILKKNVRVERNGSQVKSDELMYNIKTDTILSNERVKLIVR